MSYFIAKSIRHDKTNNTITICGGSNNVVPRSEHYYTFEIDGQYTFLMLFLDLISGSVQLNNSSSLSKKINSMMAELKERHKKSYPTKSSIDNYSIYTMSHTIQGNKEESLKNAHKWYLEYIDKPYGLEYKEYFEVYSEKWEEFRNYILSTYKQFYAELKINTEVNRQLLNSFN